MHQHTLRSGTSLWRAIGQPPLACPSLAEDIQCEVAVVGGGITGALVGYLLAKRGVDCLVLDREEVGAGSTAASTGLLQYEIDTPLVDLIDKVGEAHAVHAYRRNLRAIDELQSLTAELAEPSGFARRQTLCLASRPADAAPLFREYECRRHFGFALQHFDAAALADFCAVPAAGATLSVGDGELDPYQFTQALCRAAKSQGLRLYSQTPVRALDELPRGILLHTPLAQVTARAVVLCTGYAVSEFLGTTPGELSSTYAVASEPLEAFPGWPDQCLLWETARPYFYARQTADGRIIIGGEDTPGAFDHRRAGLLEQKAADLVRRIEQLFPQIDFAPAYAWAGTFAETDDGLPYIGRLPGRENVFAALGYGGNGITFGMIAARLLADLFLQRPNDDEGVFRFGR